MNIEETKKAIRIMQAFVDGKEIEMYSPTYLMWKAVPSPSWDFSNFDYRIKPVAKIRPWTADEVPLGALIKSKHDHWKSLILEVDKIGRICVYGGPIFREAALENHEHSTDGGKTWHPCGVMEEAKP